MKFFRRLWSDGGFRLLTLFVVFVGPTFQVGMYIFDRAIYFPWIVIGAIVFWLIVVFLGWVFRNNP